MKSSTFISYLPIPIFLDLTTYSYLLMRMPTIINVCTYSFLPIFKYLFIPTSIHLFDIF